MLNFECRKGTKKSSFKNICCTLMFHKHNSIQIMIFYVDFCPSHYEVINSKQFQPVTTLYWINLKIKFDKGTLPRTLSREITSELYPFAARNQASSVERLLRTVSSTPRVISMIRDQDRAFETKHLASVGYGVIFFNVKPIYYFSIHIFSKKTTEIIQLGQFCVVNIHNDFLKY